MKPYERFFDGNPLPLEKLVAYLTRNTFSPLFRADTPRWLASKAEVRAFYEKVFTHLPPNSEGAEVALRHLFRITVREPLALPDLVLLDSAIKFIWPNRVSVEVNLNGHIETTVF